MVQIRYFVNRAALVGALVLTSAVAGGWKWNKLGL
jgi:hypothetical protein